MHDEPAGRIDALGPPIRRVHQLSWRECITEMMKRVD